MATLKYFGHACWLLKQDGTSVLIDPFLRDNPWVKEIPADLKPDLILLTHGHFDHLGDAMDLARATDASVVGMVELAEYCQECGVKAIDGNLGGTLKFDFGWVKFVPAWHSSTWTPPGQPMRATTAHGYVIRFFDHTIYHSGDTAVFLDMQLIGELTPVDVALLPIGGHYTMGVDDAVKAVELLAPKIVIPMHYSTWPPIEQNPEDFKDKVESKTASKCVIVKPGTEWEIPATL